MKRIVSLLILLVLVLSLSACGGEGAALYEKYADIIDQLEAKNYSGAIQIITQMAMQEQMAGQEETPVVEILANTWTTNAEKGPQELTFSTDGSLTVDGKAMTWTTDKGEFGPEMRLQIFENGEHRYYAWFTASDRNAVPYISLYYMEEVDGYMQQGDQIGTYYNHPLVTVLMNSWNPVTSYEQIVEGFWIGVEESSINGDSYDWEITDATSQEKLTIHASGKNGVAGEYTMTVSMRDDYPVLTVTDDATGASGLYYSYRFGEDENWVENRYAEAKNCLTQFENNGYFWLDNEEYEDEAAVIFLQDLFAQLENFRDSGEILANWDAVWFLRANRYLQQFLENGYFYADPDKTHYSYNSGAVEYLHGLFTEIADYPEAAAVLENWNAVQFSRANQYLQRFLDNEYFHDYVDSEEIYYDDYNGAEEFIYGLFNEIADYSESAALLENWNDVLLVRANRILQDYLNNSSGQLYIDGHYLTANQSRAYVYEQFSQIQGSDEAAAILDNFTIVPQKYIGANYATVDNLGNAGSGTWEWFQYNEKGQMISADYADDLFETYGESSDLHFFYDEAGVLTEVKIAWSLESSVTAVLTPTYDANGKLISIAANYNSGTQSYTFTYDEAGRRISAVIDQNTNGGTSEWSIYRYTYTYDEAGKLIQKEKKNSSDIFTTTYTYDGNGFLIQETTVKSYYDSWSGQTTVRYTTNLIYTNDELGRHITAERTSDESSFNYKSYTVTYNYEDLYFYNAD